MNLGKNIMMIVSLMVTVILALAVLVPVIQDSSASEDTFTNDGYYRMSKITSDDEGSWVYSWTSEKPKIVVVNDVEYNIDPSGSYTIIGAGDGWVSRLVNTSSYSYIQNMYSDGLGSGGNGMKSMDCTITGGTASFSIVLADDTTSTKSMTYTYAYVLDKDGPMIMKDSTIPAYMNEDSDIFAIGVTASAGFPLNVFMITGNIEDGVTVDNTIHKSGGQDFVASNVVIHESEKTDHIDLYSLDKITFTATDGTDTINATYSYFLVPYEVTAERSVHVSTVEASLLNIIPLLVVIGIVMGAVWFIRQRN